MDGMKEHRKPKKDKKQKKSKISPSEMAVDVDEPSLQIETQTKKMKPVGSIDTGIDNQSFTNSEAVSKSSESTTRPDESTFSWTMRTINGPCDTPNSIWPILYGSFLHLAKLAY